MACHQINLDFDGEKLVSNNLCFATVRILYESKLCAQFTTTIFELKFLNICIIYCCLVTSTFILTFPNSILNAHHFI